MHLNGESMAPVFARRFRRHLVWIVLKSGVFLLVLGALTAAALVAYFDERGPGYLTALFGAAFLYFAVGTVLGLRDAFRVTILPYYERRLGTVNTFLTGKSLLANSRALDELAKHLGVSPLSDFASGDDMIWFEKLRWHDPREALRTTEQLLHSDPAKTFPEELLSDLKSLQQALTEACKQNVRFCLLLREGSYTSGLEMDRRKGSFF